MTPQLQTSQRDGTCTCTEQVFYCTAQACLARLVPLRCSNMSGRRSAALPPFQGRRSMENRKRSSGADHPVPGMPGTGMRGAEELSIAELRLPGCLISIAKAEINDLDVLLLVQQQILRLQIPMNNVHPLEKLAGEELCHAVSTQAQLAFVLALLQEHCKLSKAGRWCK